MSVNLAAKTRRFFGDVLTIVGESSWVLLSFFIVAAVVFGGAVRYIPGLENVFDATLGQLLAGGLIYTLVVIVVLLPVMRKGRGYVSKLLGVDRKPSRSIWYLPVLMFAAYMAATILAAMLASFLPWVDLEQKQETGFDDLVQPYEYVLAFIALVVLPPIAEELLFRGYLFGRLRQRFGFWLTTAVVSVVFGIVHMQWNVGIDVAVLSVFLCYLRERTGSVWASIALHGIKNGLAYFFLFIAPLLGMQLVQ